MLKVKLLNENATIPKVAHPGEDLGYDLYSCGSLYLHAGDVTKVSTGIAIEDSREGYGFIIKERSSMAVRGLIVLGGVVDAGYRGEIFVNIFNLGEDDIYIKEGERIGQLIPQPVLTSVVCQVQELSESSRGEAGYGSTGK